MNPVLLIALSVLVAAVFGQEVGLPNNPPVRGPSVRAQARPRSSRNANQPAARENARARTLQPEDDSKSSCPPNTPSCFVVSSYWPFRKCEEKCSAEVCNRGWGAWQSEEVCCSPGVAFPEGCTSRPSECWVVENWNMKTCIRDDRKCLQGFGVWGSQEACCAPGAAFNEGCGKVEASPEPCWIVDTYFPSRLCRQSNTLCDKPEAGVQAFRTKEECCAPGKAFSEGCSSPPPVPCWHKEEHWPHRTCSKSDDIALCNRGWGVYVSKEICCSPNVAFQEGCTPEPVLASAGP